MPDINIEIKAHSAKADQIRSYLLSSGAEFRGIDQQTDTYFKVSHGRLKLRQGNIENCLIHYERDNSPGPKESEFTLFPVVQGENLKQVLSRALGLLVQVRKQREIYYLDNVKFHIDTVEGLGNFVEIEACSAGNNRTAEELHRQCRYYMDLFEIGEDDLADCSYSDMLLAGKAT